MFWGWVEFLPEVPKVKTIFILILKLWCVGDISSKVKPFHFILMSFFCLMWRYLSCAVFIHLSYNAAKQTKPFLFGIFLHQTVLFILILSNNKCSHFRTLIKTETGASVQFGVQVPDEPPCRRVVARWFWKLLSLTPVLRSGAIQDCAGNWLQDADLPDTRWGSVTAKGWINKNKLCADPQSKLMA